MRKQEKENSSGAMKYILLGAVALGLLGAGIYISSKPEPAPSGQKVAVSPGRLPGLQTGEVPWPAEIENLRERLHLMGLPALQEEGFAVHIHQHLEVFIHGKAVDVPAAIGFNPMARFISPIHTHDGSGIIHIESPTPTTLTLGQFMDVWGVRFTASCIGGYCADQKNSLKLFVNGAVKEGDPRALVLTDHPVIVITYGDQGALPVPIPAKFLFPPGT